MKPPGQNTRCRRKSCKLAYALHVDGACPNGAGQFKRDMSVPHGSKRASFSLSQAEVDALATVLTVMRRSGDVRALAQRLSKPLGGVASKLVKAQRTIAVLKAGSPASVPADSHTSNGAGVGEVAIDATGERWS